MVIDKISKAITIIPGKAKDTRYIWGQMLIRYLYLLNWGSPRVQGSVSKWEVIYIYELTKLQQGFASQPEMKEFRFFIIFLLARERDATRCLLARTTASTT